MMNVLFGYADKTGNSDRFIQDMYLSAFAIINEDRENEIYKNFLSTNQVY